MKSSSSPSKGPKRILFPMRVYEKPPITVSPHMTSSLLDDESSQSSDQFRMARNRGNPKVKWVGLTPLEMVTEVLGMVDSTLENVGQECKDSKSSPIFSLPSTPVSSKKRDREQDDLDIILENSMQGIKVEPPSSMKYEKKIPLHPWQTYLTNPIYHKYSKTNKAKMEKLESLVELFRSIPAHQNCMTSYKRIHDEFKLTINSLREPSTISYPDSDCLVHSKDDGDASTSTLNILDNLMKTTELKMDALIEMATKEQDDVSPGALDSSCSVSLHVRNNVDNALTSEKNNKNRTQHQKDKSINSKSSKKVTKKEFAKYMSYWLIENWTNPYPDDHGLAEIAQECGMPTKAVGNWLINARTRKWRPAIVKACDMDRPADLLKEDAIRIFQGKSVRKIDVDV